MQNLANMATISQNSRAWKIIFFSSQVAEIDPGYIEKEAQSAVSKIKDKAPIFIREVCN